MQMIKNDKGITLISLILTIIVLILLAATTLTIGYQSLNGTVDSTKLADIQMVQQAIYERGYIITLNNADKVKLYKEGTSLTVNDPLRNEQPELYLGKPLYNNAVYYVAGLEVENDSSLGSTVISITEVKNVLEEDDSNSSNRFKLMSKVQTKKASTLYHDLYYVLDKEDLKALGIDNSADIYVVNYQTGEILNWSMKYYSDDDFVYLEGKPEEVIKPDGINAVTENVADW